MPTYNQDHTFDGWSPREIWKAYRNGFPGALNRPLETKRFLAENPYPLFHFAAPNLEGSGDGKAVVLFPYVLKHDADAYKTGQKTGDSCSDDTELLTSDGWVDVADIRADHEVATLNPNTHELEYQRPRNVLSKRFRGYMVKFDHRGFQALVTPKHRMYRTAENRIGRAADLGPEHYGFALAEEVECYAKPFRVKKNAEWRGSEVTVRDVGIHEIPMDQWLELLGYYLSDGCTWRHPDRGHGDVITETSTRVELGATVAYKRQAYTALLAKMPFRFSAWKDRLAIYDHDLLEEVEPLGKSGVKRIPEYVRQLSARQQRVLLDAMLTGDGCRSKNGQWTFYTSSPDMADDFQELCLKAGYSADVRVRDRRGESHPNPKGEPIVTRRLAYEVTVRQAQHWPRIYPKHVSREHYDGLVYCVSVPNGVIYARRNGVAGWLGNCVSHGTRNAVDLTRAVEIELKGEAEGFYVKGATEAIYGSRGHPNQGMSCAGAARFVSQTGGILLRKDYTEEFGLDLSNYKNSYKEGMAWGRKGVPAKVVAEAKKHQVGSASLIGSTREVMDALANGYGCSVCSGYGFSSKRDENGVSRRSGSWSHCMCIAGYDDTDAMRKKYRGPIFLIINSWGCHSDDTEILTRNGWRLFDDLLPGEEVATLNPDTHQLEYDVPSEHHEYQCDEPLMRFHWRGVDQLVTQNHRMYGCRHNVTDKLDPANWQMVEAAEFSGHWNMKKNARWTRPDIESHVIGEHVIDGDTWMEFLGYFISEGCVFVAKHKRDRVLAGGDTYEKTYRYPQVVVCQKKPDGVAAMSTCFGRLSCLGFYPTSLKDGTATGWRTKNRELYGELLECGHGAGNKRLPPYAMEASARQLRILYDAMMVGDGTYSPTPTGDRVVYYTGSKILADQMQEICLKIGYAADIAVVDRRGQVNDQGRNRCLLEYHVRIKEKSVIPKNSAAGGCNPILVPYHGRVYCVTTQNGIIYTRRNGVASWGGNSFNSGPKHLDQPDGTFWITEKDMRGMVNSRGTFVFSQVDGFPPQELPDWGYNWG